MESYQFYKSIYDRELNRRKDLDAAINLPLTILSILFAANSYIVKEENFDSKSYLADLEFIFMITVFLSIGFAIIYLIKSYNNFFKGFAYRNFALISNIRKYEDEIKSYNSKVVDNKLSFEDLIIEKINSLTDDHIIFNDTRSKDLYKAKTALIIAMIVTALNFILITSKY